MEYPASSAGPTVIAKVGLLQAKAFGSFSATFLSGEDLRTYQVPPFVVILHLLHQSNTWIYLDYLALGADNDWHLWYLWQTGRGSGGITLFSTEPAAVLDATTWHHKFIQIQEDPFTSIHSLGSRFQRVNTWQTEGRCIVFATGSEKNSISD